MTAEAEKHDVLRGQGAGLLLANLAEAIAAMTIVKWGTISLKAAAKTLDIYLHEWLIFMAFMKVKTNHTWMLLYG